MKTKNNSVTMTTKHPLSHLGHMPEIIEEFTRIAEARLRSQFKFGPQRRALAAKMCRRWLDRQKEKILG